MDALVIVVIVVAVLVGLVGFGVVAGSGRARRHEAQRIHAEEVGGSRSSTTPGPNRAAPRRRSGWRGRAVRRRPHVERLAEADEHARQAEERAREAEEFDPGEAPRPGPTSSAPPGSRADVALVAAVPSTISGEFQDRPCSAWTARPRAPTRPVCPRGGEGQPEDGGGAAVAGAGAMPWLRPWAR